MSNKKPVKTTQNKPARVMGPEDVKALLRKYKAGSEPAELLKDAAELWTKYLVVNDKDKPTLENKLQKKLREASAIIALENHYYIAETLNEPKYRTLMFEITDQLIAEYSCRSSTEKMLAETAAWAYCRMIECSSAFSGSHRVEFLSTEKNGHFSMLSREVDRANRQYLTAITTLKHFKQPAVSITFKAKNAFVAQNQHINPENRNKTGKNNEPQ